MKNYISKNDVMRCVSIVDVAKEYGIILEDASSGNFNKRCTCPSSAHKNGSERTASLYIDTIQNNFWCYGCSAGSNVIDFYMLCTDKEFAEALNELKKRVNPSKATGTVLLPVQSNFGDLLQISKIIRDAMRNHPDDLRWLNTLMQNVDRYIFDIPSDDVEKAKALKEKIEMEIFNRYC
jgi:hypothetical protein